MPEDKINVTGTRDALETFSFENSNGHKVHREGVFIGDPDDGTLKAQVTASGELQVTIPEVTSSGELQVAIPSVTDGDSVSVQIAATGDMISADGALKTEMASQAQFGIQQVVRVANANEQLDAFARLRVSNPETVFDSKQIHNDGALFWDDAQVSGAGTGSVWTQNTASTVLSVSAATAGNRVRQSYRRFNYQPGKSQLVVITGSLGNVAGETGIKRSMGYYDDSNGFFVQDNEGTVQIVRRSNVTGTPVDTEIDQANWNLDRLDGTGNSGITLDPSKSQIFFLDIEWLGVGRVRTGFFVDGLPVYTHEFLHANNLSGVYMSTPNLPLRYEISNDGNGGASSIEAICGSVMSEGGIQGIGQNRSASLDAAYVEANTVGTIYALVGIRLKAGNIDGVVELLAQSTMSDTADNYKLMVIFNPTVAGTPAWTDEANSVVQVGRADLIGSPSNTTVTGGTVVYSEYVKSSNTTGASSGDLRSSLQIGSAIDGTPDEMWLCVMPLGVNADITGCLTWRELS